MPASDARRLVAAPTLRCSSGGRSPSSPTCGEPASFAKLDPGGQIVGFHCVEHARANDVQLNRPIGVQLVRVTCELFLIGASVNPELAEAEATTAVQMAALGVGAGVCIHSVRSRQARYYPAARALGVFGASDS